MGNKVKFGFKNCHYAPITMTDSKITFGVPVAIPGAVSMSLDPQTDEVEFEADDMLYYTSYTNTGYKGNTEFANLPNQFLKDILKYVEDETSHVLAENLSAETAPFALLYEINGDQKATRRVLYSCNVSRPGENAQTSGKTKTPQTDTMEMTAAPLASGHVRCRTTEKTPAATYNGWYKSVYLLPAMVADMEELGYTVEALTAETQPAGGQEV